MIWGSTISVEYGGVEARQEWVEKWMWVQEMEAANVDDSLGKFAKERKEIGWELEGKVRWKEGLGYGCS